MTELRRRMIQQMTVRGLTSLLLFGNSSQSAGRVDSKVLGPS